MYNLFIKRFLDIIISLFAMPFIFVFSIPIGFYNRIIDHGTVFYKGIRYGKDMKIFNELKFRSMKMNAEDIRNDDGTTFNSEHDLRLTAIGGLIRKTSIDELPQFINVLIGDMSLVGPRPSPLGNEKTYSDLVKKKFDVKPGITGYNQMLLRNKSTLKERYRNDVYYVEHLSFKLDCKIVVCTFKNLLCMKNNVFRN